MSWQRDLSSTCGRALQALREDGPVRAESAEPPAFELPRLAAVILEVVEQIPAGKVLTYGDVAELAGEGGPRQVGTVLARYGSDVPWWRVLRADGTPAPALRERAFAAYADEGTPVRDERRVDLARARWDGSPASAPPDVIT